MVVGAPSGGRPAPRPGAVGLDLGTSRARHRLRARRDRRVRAGRRNREGGGEAVIVLELLAVALGAAAIVYLVVALVRPERF
ncbi:hypothetical protein B8281_06565 [Cellulosimicrobium sp. TH-20]|nr:hypothetical protein B8281_06565 [Cellulosimicrobium sp. TH-20]